MHDHLVGLVDKVDAAVAASRGVLPPDTLEQVAGVARSVRLRLSYPESIMVVALAGGTGSGKSSLFNAIAGDDIALTGGMRPMTVKPMALVPAASAGSLQGYLDVLGVDDRAEQDRIPWLCLIDLPDNDSVEVDHRHQVDALLPGVDLVVWVTDPEKYRDASLHQGHIGTLARRQSQFLYVLNQVDRLAEEEVALVAGDLAQALREDGIVDPQVVPIAAQPLAGPPIGIELLLQRLEERAGESTVHQRLLADLESAVSTLVASAAGERVDFTERWESGMSEAVGLALDDRVADAGQSMAAMVAAIAGDVGGEIGDQLTSLAREIPSRFLGCVLDVATSQDDEVRSRLRRRKTAHLVPDRGALEDAVERQIGDPVRDLLSRRSRAQAAVTELALGLGAQVGDTG